MAEVVIVADAEAAGELAAEQIARLVAARPDAVLGLLASVAADRHGQAAVLRALSRPQRAAGSVSAF